MGSEQYRNKLLDARKDRLDLRDREYSPILHSLPEVFPDFHGIKEVFSCYQESNMILDQGKSGACTGYALASIINYLQWRKMFRASQVDFAFCPLLLEEAKVSPKMLFTLARIYDEWESEDYEGSSCRGAMKGWHRHGVCKEQSWPFDSDQPSKGWDRESIEHPLGAYYRVASDSIADMQSAIFEVGAIYVSASIHDGWWEVQSATTDLVELEEIEKIPFEPLAQGQHAFILVGYTRHGFIVQNSWGSNWANGGFAILTYKDWLVHGLDAWVTVMGAIVEIDNTPYTYTNTSICDASKLSLEGASSVKNFLKYTYRHKNLEPFSEEKAYNHTLVLNATGRAKHTMICTSSLEKSINIISKEKLEEWLKDQKNPKVVLYALGGIENETASLERIRVLIPYFLENGLYPLFFTFKEGFVEHIEDSIENFIQSMSKKEGISLDDERLKNKSEALNRAIENHARKLPTRAIWEGVKRKSKIANMESIEVFDTQTRGILEIVSNNLFTLNKKYPFEIHAISHLEGSELLATTWLEKLKKLNLKVKSMHFLAPTLTVQDGNKYITPACDNRVLNKSKVFFYLLDSDMNKKGKLGYYGESILTLISRSLEEIHKTPLLGLNAVWSEESFSKKDALFNTQQLCEIENWYEFTLSSRSRFKKYVLSKKDAQLKTSLNYDSVELSNENLMRSVTILNHILRVIVLGKTSGEIQFPVEVL